MNWKEISVITERICVDAIAGIFHRLGSGGVVIEDPQVLREHVNTELWDPRALSPEFLHQQFVVIKAYFHEDKDVINELYASLNDVKENFNNPQIKVLFNEVKNEDWEQSWKKYYHTFKIGKRLVIKPSWLEYQPLKDEVIIEIDPGMAFGTGIHASTRFCLHFIDQLVKGGEYIVDAGCGSGILSIAAAKLGAQHILAVDIDNLAVQVAKENILLNSFSNVIEVVEGDIIKILANQRADIIFANILAEVINQLIPEAAKTLPTGGYLLASGIVVSRWPGVEKQLRNHGFLIDRLLSEEDWVGVAARKV